MDERLELLLIEVKKYVDVYAGEHPLSNKDDAIRVAERAGILYRYARNGDTYEVRWTQEHPVLYVPASNLCELLMKSIVEAHKPKGEAATITVDATDEDEASILEIPETEATDAAMKLAEEFDLDLGMIDGTGRDGKITVGDIRKALDYR